MEKAVTMRLSSGGSSVDWSAEAETARQGEERHGRRRCRLGKPIDDDSDSDSGASTAASLCRRWCCCCGVARAADALRTEAPQSAAAEKERALSIGER